MKFRAEVFVTLKPVVNDPAGLTIRGGLHALGFETVDDVRSGKYLVLTLEEPDEAQARSRVEEMSRQLLANEVIEDFRIELQEELIPSPLAAAGPSAHASGASVPGERLRGSGRGGGS
jgi:phosphoribosylformylglycinamidine synthase subunit PurS